MRGGDIVNTQRRKKKNHKKAANPIFLFIYTFVVVFVGLTLSNIFAVTINCLYKGFDNFLIKLFQLPYLLYLVFSLIFAIIFTLIIIKKRKL